MAIELISNVIGCAEKAIPKVRKSGDLTSEDLVVPDAQASATEFREKRMFGFEFRLHSRPS
jgi:hypothetical protein